jgi:hypothetical protein
MNRSLRATAVAMALSLSAGPSGAANLTPDELTQATGANPTDLMLIYPAGGPMKSMQWSVVTSLMQSALGGTFLQVGNNLADLNSPSSARNNLALGTAATQNTGVSGAALPFLNGANTWSGAQTFTATSAFGGKVTLFASTGSGAPLNIPQGAAPSAPANGDCWTTSVGLYCQINGATQGPFAASTGTVTTTGSPANGELAAFSGASSIVNGNLSGDCATSGALALTCTKTNGTAFGTFATANAATPPAIGGATPAAGSFTTLGASGLITPSTTNGIKGTTAADSANAGSIGEYISTNVASSSAVSLASGGTANVTSVSLTAGDWDCRGDVMFHMATTTTSTDLSGAISTTSATFPTGPGGGAEAGIGGPTFSENGSTIGDQALPVGEVRENVASTTTVFLVAYSVFATSTNAAYGFLGCRRVR